MLQAGKLLLSKLVSFGGGSGILALIAAVLVLLPSEEAQARRYASIVIDAETGQVLHADRPDRQAYPASLTKMMTLYMAFEALDLGKLKMNQPLKVSRRAAGMAPSKLGLRAGRSILVKDAIMALITKSANDVAVVVAEALGGSESEFARLMTRKARALGMKNTVFRNASGLPNRHQLSTARDMARLAQALMRHFPERYKLFSTRSFSYKGRTYRNHNRLLRTYDGTDGIKTGYTHASGFNLVASAVRNNRRIIAVVFGGRTSRSRDRHIAKLMDRAFARVRTAARIEPLPQHPPRKPISEPETVQLAEASAEGTPGDSQSVLASGAGLTLAGASALAALPVDPRGQSSDAEKQEQAEGNSRLIEDAPHFRTIPKRKNYHTARGAPNSPVPHPPAFAAIPERGDYDTAQGSAESPVRTPPPYDAIPRRPLTFDLEASVQPSAGGPTDNGGKTFKVITKRASAKAFSWGVQVGAYSQVVPAQLAARDAARRLPELSATEVSVSAAPSAQGKIYRARLIGLDDEATARRACGKLERLKLPCHVVAPEARG